MKIIAIVKQGHVPVYLAEVTSQEVATIAKGDIHGGIELDVGDEIPIRKHWRRVYDIEQAQGQLDNAAKSLRAVADLLGSIDVVVPAKAQEGGAK